MYAKYTQKLTARIFKSPEPISIDFWLTTLTHATLLLLFLATSCRIFFFFFDVSVAL